METNEILACLVCLVPFILGGLFGWTMKGRVARYGLAGALLPGFIRNILERYQ